VGEEQDVAGMDLLSRLSTEMVRAQKKYFGRGPSETKSYMLDDFLLIVMRGSQTQAERTMIEFGQENLVREFRQQFENEMTSRLVDMVEDLTGRNVRGYQSQVLFDPEVVIEIFFLKRRPPSRRSRRRRAASSRTRASARPPAERRTRTCRATSKPNDRRGWRAARVAHHPSPRTAASRAVHLTSGGPVTLARHRAPSSPQRWGRPPCRPRGAIAAQDR
jgi:uncharacterized protein YbcI